MSFDTGSTGSVPHVENPTPAPAHARPPKDQEHIPPSLMTVWLIVLGVAVLWCLLPTWETLFLGGSVPGIYWLFIADTFGLKVILVFVGGVALAEAVMVATLALSKPAARGQMTAATGIGFLALLLLVARLGMAQLDFAPLLDHHMGTVETGQHIYFLAHESTGGPDDSRYTFVQCDTLGIWCAQMAEVHTPPSPGGPQATLEYDSRSHTLKVVESGQTYYSYPLDG
jgi:hypothetical protein